jgi:hypothetical protein
MYMLLDCDVLHDRLSSRQGRRPMTNKTATVLTTTNIWSWDLEGLDAKTDWQTDWLTDRPTDWLTDRLTDWLADWLTDRLTGWLTDRPTEWPIGWLTVLLAGWLTYWLTDWLAGWPSFVKRLWLTPAVFSAISADIQSTFRIVLQHWDTGVVEFRKKHDHSFEAWSWPLTSI